MTAARRWLRVAAGLCAATLAAGARGDAPAAKLLDDFQSLAPWTSFASDDVTASVSAAPDGDRHALRLTYDFRGHAGYALARRDLPLAFPENFEVSFAVRGTSPPNDFQLKFVDASGENVWWFRRADFEFSADWRTVKFRKRQVEFAWGPTADRHLKSTAAIEFVVAAGKGGGGGTIDIAALTLKPLPAVDATPAKLQASATQSLAGSTAAAAVDGRADTAWRASLAIGQTAYLTVDLGASREFGGLSFDWLQGREATDFEIVLSDDGVQWMPARAVRNAHDTHQAVMLTDAEARFIRLHLLHAASDEAALAELTVEPLAFGATPNDFFRHVAEHAPRGEYPRAYAGEQSYWTVVGADGGGDEGLLSEDGAFELRKAAPSLEPRLTVDGESFDWATVAIDQTLRDRYLPMPAVHWRGKGWQLDISAFAADESPRDFAILRYRYTNRSDNAQSVSLTALLRPFQVNPPTQFLNGAGGVAPVRDLDWDSKRLRINRTLDVIPLTTPDGVTAVPFDTASASSAVLDRAQPLTRLVDDFGYASAALAYRRTVAPAAHVDVAFLVPWHDLPAQRIAALRARGGLDRLAQATARSWHGKLDRVGITGTGVAQPAIDTVRTALAHILINRDGPRLQPGSRSYERSWIRDGSLESEALLRLGHESDARAFLDWYSGYQFSNGKIPCCVDARGADSVPENDSPGEFLWLVRELYRYTGDRAALERDWPKALAALAYLESLRQSERTRANESPDRRRYYGLVPPSISHEGYSAKPMHSYWDDFWALAGYDSAAELAAAIAAPEAKTIAAHRDEFRADLHASIAAAVRDHRIDFIPGAADLGDFDATSTTIALSPVGDLAGLPRALVEATFERYWQEFTARREGRGASPAYTPYEIRSIGSFVRLGWRSRANQLLAYFLNDRRPSAWNQWAEVVSLKPREPRFIGDMPHTWVASDFIRSFTDLFAYEREADRALVLGAGIDPAWLAGDGIALKNLRTPYGSLSFSLKRQGSSVRLQVARGVSPPGGIVLRLGTEEVHFDRAPVNARIPWARAGAGGEGP